ncbi:MAG TPA: CocE/NonD family hydrolase, partial [Actinomycetota bacterium]|nr:CocE/NonD family hydrolase [Actinomycetota bacterium]
MRAIRLRSVLVVLTAIGAFVAGVVPGALAKGPPPEKARNRPPADYVAMADELSQPIYPQTIREVHTVEAFDGESLYVEIVRPDPEEYGEGPWPVVLEASPYHGTLHARTGTRILPDPVDEDGQQVGLTGFFAPRGYAVAMMDLRGTGRSTGCLEHLGPDDSRDLSTVIEWLAGQEWSNGRVGMTGHSYVGSTPNVAAALPKEDREGLVTIVPSAGLASMYDHQFSKGVPWNLQWAGPQWAYEILAIDRDLPPQLGSDPVQGGATGDNWENAPNPQFGCGLQHSALTAGTGQVTGQYQGWHAARDWRTAAAATDIPIFMVHGVNDNAARIPAAEWFFADRPWQPGDKIWLGQWDHGSGNHRCGSTQNPPQRVAHPNCRFDQWTYALLAWFDSHLKQMDVDTGPAVEVFLNEQRPVNVTQVVDPESLDARVFTSNRWSFPRRALELFPDATDMSLKFAPPADNASASFRTVADAIAAHVAAGNVTFTSDPLPERTLITGMPDLQLNASVVSPQVAHLVTTLWRVRTYENEKGETVTEREQMNFCAINPLQRNGIDRVEPVTPNQEMELDPQCFTMAHWVPAGQRLQLVVSTTTTPAHYATSGTYPQVTIFTGPEKTRYTLPSVVKPKLYEDVPLRIRTEQPPVGPAQPAITGSVTLGPPGVPPGAREPGLDSQFFEFDILDGFDNASFTVAANAAVPAGDIDLYLQRQRADGTWTGALASGTDFVRAGNPVEDIESGRRMPGHYRVEVVNFAAPPGPVNLTITFFNQAGEPGPAPGSGSEAYQLVEGNQAAVG